MRAAVSSVTSTTSPSLAVNINSADGQWHRTEESKEALFPSPCEAIWRMHAVWPPLGLRHPLHVLKKTSVDSEHSRGRGMCELGNEQGGE